MTGFYEKSTNMEDLMSISEPKEEGMFSKGRYYKCTLGLSVFQVVAGVIEFTLLQIIILISHTFSPNSVFSLVGAGVVATGIIMVFAIRKHCIRMDFVIGFLALNVIILSFHVAVIVFGAKAIDRSGLSAYLLLEIPLIIIACASIVISVLTFAVVYNNFFCRDRGMKSPRDDDLLQRLLEMDRQPQLMSGQQALMVIARDATGHLKLVPLPQHQPLHAVESPSEPTSEAERKVIPDRPPPQYER